MALSHSPESHMQIVSLHWQAHWHTILLGELGGRENARIMWSLIPSLLFEFPYCTPSTDNRFLMMSNFFESLHSLLCYLNKRHDSLFTFSTHLYRESSSDHQILNRHKFMTARRWCVFRDDALEARGNLTRHVNRRKTMRQTQGRNEERWRGLSRFWREHVLSLLFISLSTFLSPVTLLSNHTFSSLPGEEGRDFQTLQKTLTKHCHSFFLSRITTVTPAGWDTCQSWSLFFCLCVCLAVNCWLFCLSNTPTRVLNYLSSGKCLPSRVIEETKTLELP